MEHFEDTSNYLNVAKMVTYDGTKREVDFTRVLVEASSQKEAEEIVENDIFEGRRQAPYNCTNSWFETNEMNEFSYLVDGVTSCCGYDFGIDMDKAKFCPVCGERLIKKE